MSIEFDARKDRLNVAKHGVSLKLAAALFEWPTVEQIDDRHDDEARINALGIVAGRVFHCTYIWRGEHRRIISLRKATRQEANDYFQITQSDR